MNSSVSNFFTREKDNSPSKRQVRARKNTPLHFFRPSKSEPLQIIPEEEDEPRPSTSSCASSSPRSSVCQTPDLKKRRPAVLPANIRITKSANTIDNDFDHDISLLSAPRPAPRPPCQASLNASPKSSPNSFRLTFTDTSFEFPHPPIPTPSSSDYHFASQSPTLSSSTSSPSSQSTGLPLTPSSSDDEFQLSPAPKFNPRRASIRPLTILKHNALPSMFANSPSPSSISDGSSDSDSDSDSDSEWYARELSQVLILRSALPPSFPKAVINESARPESFSGSVFEMLPPLPSPYSDRNLSKTLHSSPASSPRTPSGCKYPSAQLDPAYPRRHSANFIVPNRPPPPPPELYVPFYLRSGSSSPASYSDEVPSLEQSELPERPKNPEPRRSLSLRRPPPRMSIPTDFGFFPEELMTGDNTEELEGDDEDDGNVLTYYIQPEGSSAPTSSSGSIYSQTSELERFSIADLDEEFEFELDVNLDRPMMLPLSLPNSPIDLETDIANGLEQLRSREKADVPVSAVSEVASDFPPTSTNLTRSASALARRQIRREMVVSVPVGIEYGIEWDLQEEGEATAKEQLPAQVDTSSSLPALSFEDNEPSYEEHDFNLEDSDRILRSRWSSSTLSSIREEQQQQRWRGSKLRLYFGGTKKRSNSNASAPLSPITPTTPSKSRSNPKTKTGSKKRAVVVVGPPSSASGSSGWSFGSSLKSPSPMSPTSAVGPMSPYFDYNSHSPTKRSRKQRHSEDDMIVGYGPQRGSGTGVRRRGSTSTTSESSVAGSSDTASIMSGVSDASSGLRRKPIPVEMFLRA